jgi:predicted extracellular nuclease
MDRWSRFLVIGALFAATAALQSPAGAAPASVVINEIDYDQPSTDAAEFLELKNVGSDPVDLDPVLVEFVNGSSGGAVVYLTIDLPDVDLDAGDYFVVCANAATVPNCDLDVAPDTNLIQNGAPDAIGLRDGADLIDAVSYEGDTGPPYTEGSGAGLVDDGSAVDGGIARCPDGTDTNQNNVDLRADTITPGAANGCVVFTPMAIHDIQGAAHISPQNGEAVQTTGVVTAVRSNGFYFQDPAPDADEATSEGLLVFTSSAPAVLVGDAVSVNGFVAEFRPGGPDTANLTTTELITPKVTVSSSGNPLPAATVIGTGGRVPPGEVIDDDATGDVETSGVFDPATDGIDFYESLEGMRVQVNEAVAVGPRNDFGEIPVIGDDGANASVRTPRGGIIIRPNDFNPERIILDDTLLPTPSVHVADGFTTPVAGVLDYSFGNFKLNITSALTPVDGGLEREATAAPSDQEIAVATFNVENLDPGDPPSKFAGLAEIVVSDLEAPDIISVEEVQDNNGPIDDEVVDASVTWNMLIAAIQAAGGPAYEYRQIDPIDDADGGEPGGNIRVGFLFRTDRGVSFIDRPGGDATTPTEVIDHPSGPRLSISPGRVDPNDPAWSDPEGVRKPLAGEFRARGKKLFVIANHWKSKSGDDPLFGRFQPPKRITEQQRNAEAQVVKDFVDEILALDAKANVIVLGDLNDFEFSDALTILEGGGDLHTLIETLPQNERYSFVFEGNSQTLDHIVVSGSLFGFPFVYDSVHVNAEFADQISDHDPQVVRLALGGRPK